MITSSLCCCSTCCRHTHTHTDRHRHRHKHSHRHTTHTQARHQFHSIFSPLCLYCRCICASVSCRQSACGGRSPRHNVRGVHESNTRNAAGAKTIATTTATTTAATTTETATETEAKATEEPQSESDFKSKSKSESQFSDERRTTASHDSLRCVGRRRR